MSLDRQRADLGIKIGHLLNQLVGLSMYPDEDPFEDGEVIWFQKKFPGDSTEYTFVAIRANGGNWWTTGQRSPNVFRTWADLCSWMGRGVDEIYRMTRAHVPTIDAKTTKKEFLAELRSQIFPAPDESVTSVNEYDDGPF